MGRRPSLGPPFATVAMVEILLAQDLWQEARAVLDVLVERQPADPRVADLRRRLERRSQVGEIEQEQVTAAGEDRVALELDDQGLRVTWELTARGLEIARRAVKYSGRSIVRLFTAIAGPRGVRTQTRDIELDLEAGRIALPGVPLPAVYTAAVGFLGRNGAFVPLSRSETVGGGA